MYSIRGVAYQPAVKSRTASLIPISQMGTLSVLKIKGFMQSHTNLVAKPRLKLNLRSLGLIPKQIDGETVATVTDIIFLDSKITVDGDCSHEIKDASSLEGKL